MVRYQSITKTLQNSNNSCMLACIESFFSDLNTDMTQKEMIEKLLPDNLCDDQGYVLGKNIREVGKILGLNINKVKYHFPINDKYADNSLFIGIDLSSVAPKEVKKQNNNRLHMVRYNRHINDNEFIIMDPAGWFGLRIWNKEDLDKVYEEFLYVNIIERE